MKDLSRSPIPSSAPKMVVFATVTIVLIGLLATLIGNISFAESRTYYALFTDATGVAKGDRVRLSGVEVGSVKGFELVRRGDQQLAKLEFSVESTVPVYADAELQLRFENIVGQRYLSISEKPGARKTMAEHATFGPSQTAPALSLTELFNGFQPLFRALDPERLNTFSFELVRALQGEAGTIQGLMRSTAQLTNTIADRDEVIGRVVTNLNAVLQTVGERDDKLTELIVQFRDLMSGLAKDSGVLSANLPPLAELLEGTAGVLVDVRPPLRQDLAGLRSVAEQIFASKDVLEQSLIRTPQRLRVQARTGSYGSWFNFYVCDLEVTLELLNGATHLTTPRITSNEKDTVCGGVGQ